MADSTIFEERGVQAAAVITDSFRRTGESMARRRGFPNYRYVVVTNPIGSLGLEGVRARAEEALPQVLDILGITDLREGPPVKS